MSETIVSSGLDIESAQHFAHCQRILTRAKFQIGDSVRLTRKGRREIGFRLAEGKPVYRHRGKVKEIKVHAFVRGERYYRICRSCI